MHVKILIVEDELIIAEDMRSMLEDSGYVVCGVTGDPEEAKRLIMATQPDIILLDITLGVKQLGLELAQYIVDNHHTPFIFCTSHGDKSTIQSATAMNPYGYLIKPFEQVDLYSAIELALVNYSQNKTATTDQKLEGSQENVLIKDSLFIKEGNLYVKVLIVDILWLSSDGNYTEVHMKKEKKSLVRIPLKDLHEQLPKPQFFRAHRSYVINLDAIEAVNNQSVLINGIEIPLGKNHRDELFAMIRKMS
ncbi:LytR/AlgR family response regulator transcription factor [Ekhidna sp. To15]|uniref:LytR/AlgR family response regulator transcription factor n=1 Tax=Ekhidna sp. To15 TaxID=3395267 RepID=UPI003F51C6E1